MAVVPDATDAVQAEGDGADGSDSKPPNRPQHQTMATSTTAPNPASKLSQSHSAQLNGKSHPAGASPSRPPTKRSTSHNNATVPLPPPDANAFPKQPGATRGDLAMLARTPSGKSDAAKSAGGTSVSSHSPTPTISDSEWSVSAPPPKAKSRANSTTSERSAILKVLSGKSPRKNSMSGPPPASPDLANPVAPPGRLSRPPSVKSDDGGHKFTLKDLLANGPKLGRRSSQRSTGGSSRKSDSDAKSVGGDSATSLLKKYGVCEKVAIGKGATSVVRLAHKWDRTEEKLYAVKEFRKRRKNETEKEYVKKLTAEFCISSTLHHVNIVETVDLVQDEAQHWCEVMEFCPGGDLYAAIKKGGMSPSEVECCFKQILTGLAYLHGQGVAHRDIKPENLFFDMKGHLKIGDYGASTVYRLPWEKTVHMSTGLCGSEPYIAPEQFLGKPYDARLVDIWACGIVYYCLHFQELPWRVAQTSDPLYATYATACASPQAEKSASPQTVSLLSPRQCRPLIRKMLEPDPKQRWTIEEVMKHSWIESVEVCHTSAQPAHIHVHAQALAKAQIHALGNAS